MEDGRVLGSMTCLQEVVVWRSQPTRSGAEFYRDRWGEREHSCCQLFPVTVDCVNRKEHASFFSSSWMEEWCCPVLLKACQSSCFYRELPQNTTSHCRVRQCRTEQWNLNIKVSRQAPEHVSWWFKRRAAHHVIGHLLWKFEHFSNYYNKQDYKTLSG